MAECGCVALTSKLVRAFFKTSWVLVTGNIKQPTMWKLPAKSGLLGICALRHSLSHSMCSLLLAIPPPSVPTITQCLPSTFSSPSGHYSSLLPCAPQGHLRWFTMYCSMFFFFCLAVFRRSLVFCRSCSCWDTWARRSRISFSISCP